MQTPQLENLTVVSGLIVSVIVNIGLAVKFLLERKDKQDDRRTNVEIKAYEHLTAFVDELQEELKTTRDDGKEKSSEIKGLETSLDSLRIKIRSARFDILEAWSVVKQIRSVLKDKDLYDERFEKTLDELEMMLKQIGDSLKFEQ